MRWVDVALRRDVAGARNGLRRDSVGEAFAYSDPYAIWAELSEFRSFTNNRFFRRQPQAQTGVGADDWVSFIAMAKKPEDVDKVDLIAFVPSVYRRTVPGCTGRSLCFTGRIPRSRLHLLDQHPGIVRWELGLAMAVPDALHGADGFETHWNEALGTGGRPGPKEVIAVIDYGCAILNRCFRDRSGLRTRIHHYWDQGVMRSGSWRKATGFGYGRVLTNIEIDAILAQRREMAARGQGSDESDEYRRLGLLHFRADSRRHVRSTAHGTHVLDVAGGRLDPWTRVEDRASGAGLVFIELPFRTAADGSGGSISVHLLDGLREVLRVGDPEARIMVSLSQGTHAGPHDGSSLIEIAMDELLTMRTRNFCIVIGAGNARQSQAHVRTELAPGQKSELHLHLPECDRTDSFVEVWYPRVVNGEGTEVVVSAAQPGGGEVHARSGEVKALAADDSSTPSAPAGSAESVRKRVAALIHRSSSATGGDALALLALGPADQVSRAAGVGVPPGVWRLCLHNTGKHPLLLDCYVERDEPVRLPSFAYPKFLPRGGTTGPTETGTLNTLATGRHTISAGASLANTGAPSPYSSLGPVRGGPRTGLPMPQVYAAADESTQLPGLRASGVRSGSTFRMNGTSVAAPTLARLLFLRMADHDVERGDWADEVAELALTCNRVVTPCRSSGRRPVTKGGDVRCPLPIA